ncbi:tetratricopeptide repeat protein [Ornithinibacillus contaminans]|uniref:tetratricopeptide repeat protein n=1 Tax=Ornithinibacillus contaminans TaxID=694055 RepID=UPI00064DB7E7|nr:tetratricopeptide repeat protein [Ornithinibacillus contaminans]
MGIDLGQAIRINRLRLNMTQTELASGIISVSYLSKIENGTAEPPKEIVELLGEKLKLDPLKPDNTINDQYVLRWFYHIMQANVDESIRLYNKLKHNLTTAIDKKLLSLIEIHKLHYFNLISDKTEAEKLALSLQKSSNRFTETEKYYYLKFLGNYHYTQLNYRKALECYQEAEKYSKSDIFHQLEEIYSLYYLIGSAASKCMEPHLCILYTIRALDYYQKNYNLKKCADCHILLGISYRRLNDLEKATECYQYAIRLVEKNENKEQLILCYQNLGNVYSSSGKSLEAINYFLKNYELRIDSSLQSKLIPISSLMKEYYKLNDMENAKVWLDLGFNLSKNLDPSESIFVYEFQVYQYLINGINNSFESLIIDHIIPFFREKQLYYQEATYIKILSDYYFDNRKYKLAATYYQMLVNDTKYHTERG